MRAIFLFLLSLGLSISLGDDFHAFQILYGKQYLPQELSYREKVFRYNLKWIEKMNSQRHSYTLGVSRFADMTNTEFASSLFSSCLLQSKTHKDPVHLNNEPAPSIDWREKGAVTPVKDQGDCGACWAFSATGAMEGGHFIYRHESVSVSEQELIDCDTEDNGCGGGLMTGAFLYAMGGGVCSEEDYPYHAKDEDCKLCHHAAVRPRNYEEIESEDGLALKKAVSLAPVSVAIEADSPVFQHYKSGVIDDESCGASLNHGVLAVGYTEDYWIVKNSWGEDWGGKDALLGSSNRPRICQDQVRCEGLRHLRYQPDGVLSRVLSGSFLRNRLLMDLQSRITQHLKWKKTRDLHLICPNHPHHTEEGSSTHRSADCTPLYSLPTYIH